MRQRTLTTGLATLGVLLCAPIGLGSSAVPQPGEVIGTIKIPAIGVDMPFVEDTGKAWPGAYPMHYGETLLPGEGQLIAIAGHRTTSGAPFSRVGELQKGAFIYLTKRSKFDGGGVYRYKVTGQKLFWCRDAWQVCSSAAKEGFRKVYEHKLVITTCESKGRARRFVYAYYEGGAKKP